MLRKFGFPFESTEVVQIALSKIWQDAIALFKIVPVTVGHVSVGVPATAGV
jgi:hypothetical protein